MIKLTLVSWGVQAPQVTNTDMFCDLYIFSFYPIANENVYI